MAMARQHGVLRQREASAIGIHPEVLRRLAGAGRLVRVSRGVYAPADRDASEHQDLALAAARVPRGVVCLLSALQYHELGTQLPHEVWMMVDRRAHRPRIDHPPMRFVLGSGASLSEGVEQACIEGQVVRIFSPAKTVIDCFRYRRHVGLEVAIEALRATLREGLATPNELHRLASKCRIATVMRPYLEAVA